MPSVNLRELRNTRQLKAWLSAGETVELRERDRVLAQITPANPKSSGRTVEWPDFEGRARKMFGDRVLPGADLLIEERERSRY